MCVCDWRRSVVAVTSCYKCSIVHEAVSKQTTSVWALWHAGDESIAVRVLFFKRMLLPAPAVVYCNRVRLCWRTYQRPSRHACGVSSEAHAVCVKVIQAPVVPALLAAIERGECEMSAHLCPARMLASYAMPNVATSNVLCAYERYCSFVPPLLLPDTQLPVTASALLVAFGYVCVYLL